MNQSLGWGEVGAHWHLWRESSPCSTGTGSKQVYTQLSACWSRSKLFWKAASRYLSGVGHDTTQLPRPRQTGREHRLRGSLWTIVWGTSSHTHLFMNKTMRESMYESQPHFAEEDQLCGLRSQLAFTDPQFFRFMRMKSVMAHM